MGEPFPPGAYANASQAPVSQSIAGKLQGLLSAAEDRISQLERLSDRIFGHPSQYSPMRTFNEDAKVQPPASLINEVDRLENMTIRLANVTETLNNLN